MDRIKGVPLSVKADLSSFWTMLLSGFGFFMDLTNSWATEYMPLITAFGILSSAALTAWYYRQKIRQEERNRALEHKRMEHEIFMQDRRHEHRRKANRGESDD